MPARSVARARRRVTRFGEIASGSSLRGIGDARRRTMMDAHRTHISAARPRQESRRNPIVVVNAAVLKRFETYESLSIPLGNSYPSSAATLARAQGSKGGGSKMNLSESLELARANWRKQEGQTMAEYGVILAVITGGIVLALTALSTGVQTAIGNVVKSLTG